MITEQKLFDLSFLEQMDDNNFLSEAIELFLQDTDYDLGEMSKAYDAGDLETIYRTAHKLKSSTGLIQANKLFVILEKTEIIAEAGGATIQLAELLQTARYDFVKLSAALKFHLQCLQTAA